MIIRRPEIYLVSKRKINNIKTSSEVTGGKFA